MERDRVDDLLAALYHLVEDEENALTITEIPGYLLYRVNYQSSRDIAYTGSDIFKNKFSYSRIVIMHQLVQSNEQ